MRLIKLLLFAALTIDHHLAEPVKSGNAYPDIQDLFPKVPESEAAPIQDLDIDIERIDLEKFKKQLDDLQTKLMGNETKLTGNETRRQAFPNHGGSQYKRASRYIVKIKACDLSLQAIYMTRHRVRQLENEKYYNKTDTGYRIAFLYRTLRRIYRKIRDIFTMITTKYLNTFYYTNLSDNFKMHGRIIKLYEDFQYLFWVLVNVDGKYLQRIRRTTPAVSTTVGYTRGTRIRTTTGRSTIAIFTGYKEE